jgi:protein-S-isoprenylcysteine O-methyltransferase Ste14
MIPLTYQNYIVLSLLWIAYCVVHSALISVTVTDFLKGVLGRQYRFYRVFFNLFSLATLILLLGYSNSVPREMEPLFSWKGLRLFQCTLIAFGVFLLLAGGRHYNLLQFLGIKQILDNRWGGGMTEGGDLDTGGILKVTRHPWYLGVFLLIWAGDISLRELVINTVLSLYLVIGTFLEERKLVLEFGDKYKEYQRQVSMFIPLKWLGSKPRR